MMLSIPRSLSLELQSGRDAYPARRSAITRPQILKKRGARLGLAFDLLIAALCVGVAAPLLAEEPLVVIVHPSNSIKNLDKTELAKIYLRQSERWPSDGSMAGKALVPLDLPASESARVEFSKLVLERSLQDLKGYWLSERLKGGARPPLAASSPEEVLKVVAKVPTAIGYVRKSQAKSAEVRIVLELWFLLIPQRKNKHAWPLPQKQNRVAGCRGGHSRLHRVGAPDLPAASRKLFFPG